MRLRNQLANAAENLAREENLTPVLILTMYKDLDEQLKLAHKLFLNYAANSKLNETWKKSL